MQPSTPMKSGSRPPRPDKSRYGRLMYPPHPHLASASESIKVEVTTVTGAVAEISMPANSNARKLKDKIKQHWEVPVICQRLVVDALVLEDGDQLCAFLSDDRVAVTLLKSLGKLHAGTLDECLDVVEAMGTGFMSAEANAVEILSSYAAGNYDVSLRIAAVRSLANVAHAGDDNVLKTLIHCSEVAGGHIYQDLRMAAAKALGRLSMPDNEVVLDALRSCLEDSDRMVRAAASTSLSQLSAKANDSTLSTAVPNASVSVSDDSVHRLALDR